MDRHELGTGIAQATRVQLRIAAWLLIALGGVGAARAADEAATKPLDLSLPRQAGQWIGVTRGNEDGQVPADAGQLRWVCQPRCGGKQ